MLYDSGHTRPLMNLLLLWAMSCLTQESEIGISWRALVSGWGGVLPNPGLWHLLISRWQWLTMITYSSGAIQMQFEFQMSSLSSLSNFEACGVRLGLWAARGLPGVSTTPRGSTRRPAGGDVQGANSSETEDLFGDFSRDRVLTLRFCWGSCCVQDMLWPHFPQFDSFLSMCISGCPTDHPTRDTDVYRCLTWSTWYLRMSSLGPVSCALLPCRQGIFWSRVFWDFLSLWLSDLGILVLNLSEPVNKSSYIYIYVCVCVQTHTQCRRVFEFDMYRTFCCIDKCNLNANLCW